MVDASLVVIRPGKRVSSRYLKNLLGSYAYQEWIRAHARGSAIQRISVRTLRQLPVPAPQNSIQEQVVEQADEERDDAFAVLARIVMGDNEDPIALWLLGSPEAQELRWSAQTADRVALLDRMAHSVQTFQEQIARSHAESTSFFTSWLKDLAESMKPLKGLNHVPPGSGRMALLDGAENRLKDVHSAILGMGNAYWAGDDDMAGWRASMGFPDDPSERNKTMSEFAHAITFTGRISRLVRAELFSILDDVNLEPSIEPGAVVTGKENEIQVRVKNLSSLALRNVSVSTSPSVGEGRVAYLAEDKPLSFTARIPAGVATGLFPFKLRWRAERLYGRPVSGELPLAVDVRSTSEAVHVADIGASPYIVGSPIDRNEMFYGRQDIINRIQRQFSTSDRASVILLEGNRRTGKTSILKHLQGSDALPGWIVVNCSLQGGQGHKSKPGLETNEVFRLLARDVGWAMDDAGVRVWPPNMDLPETRKPYKPGFVTALSKAFSGPRPFEAFELYIQAVLEAASPRRLLLMLDEFDKLQEGIDSGITSPQVPENIRYMLHTYPGLSAILTGSRRLKRLREEYWSALFGFGHRIPVNEIPLADARLLVTRPVEGRLTYVPDARDRVVELCSQQPFLIQSLCNRIFERAVLTEERTVTVGAAESCAEDMTKDNEHFHTLWGYARTDRRRFILVLCRKFEDGPDPITLSLLEMKLEESGVAIPRGESLGDDLEFLRELELLELQDSPRGSAYMLAVPLMANWIGHNVDFEHQRRQAVREREESDIFDGFGAGATEDEQ